MSKKENNRLAHQKVSDLLQNVLTIEIPQERGQKRVLRTEDLTPAEIFEAKLAYAIYQGEVKGNSLCKKALKMWEQMSTDGGQIIYAPSLRANWTNTLFLYSGEAFFEAYLNESNPTTKRHLNKIGELFEQMSRLFLFWEDPLNAETLQNERINRRMRAIADQLKLYIQDPSLVQDLALNDLHVHLNCARQIQSGDRGCFSPTLVISKELLFKSVLEKMGLQDCGEDEPHPCSAIDPGLLRVENDGLSIDASLDGGLVGQVGEGHPMGV
jgi:hypothetical protein